MPIKFTKEQEEFAAKVSNDVSEDIDCGETRKQLREMIRFWAADAADQAVARVAAETRLKIISIAIKDL